MVIRRMLGLGLLALLATGCATGMHSVTGNGGGDDNGQASHRGRRCVPAPVPQELADVRGLLRGDVPVGLGVSGLRAPPGHGLHGARSPDVGHEWPRSPASSRDDGLAHCRDHPDRARRRGHPPADAPGRRRGIPHEALPEHFRIQSAAMPSSTARTLMVVLLVSSGIRRRRRGPRAEHRGHHVAERGDVRDRFLRPRPDELDHGGGMAGVIDGHPEHGRHSPLLHGERFGRGRYRIVTGWSDGRAV